MMFLGDSYTPKKTLQHCQVLVTPVHQTQSCDTDWAHSITTNLMPGLVELSIYFNLAFPSSPQQDLLLHKDSLECSFPSQWSFPSQMLPAT